DALQEPADLGRMAELLARHDDRIDHDEAGRQFRIASAQLERDRPSKAVADHDGPLQSKLGALPGDVVGKSRHGVALLRRIACPMAAEVDRDDPAGLTEMGELRREDSMITGPAIDQEEGWGARVGRSCLDMRQPYAVALQERWLQSCVGIHVSLL